MDPLSLCSAELLVDTVRHAEEVVREGLRERSPLLGFWSAHLLLCCQHAFCHLGARNCAVPVGLCPRVGSADGLLGWGGRGWRALRRPPLCPPRSGKEPRLRHGLGGRRNRRGRWRRQDPDEALPPAGISTLPAGPAEAPGTRQRLPVVQRGWSGNELIHSRCQKL